MGCASSKQKRCGHCDAPYSPVPRSYSVHVVGVTSSTLGSLKQHHEKVFEEDDGEYDEIEKEGLSLLEKKPKELSKTWPNGIVTPTRTPPGEPETINTWELMEGLEDITATPFRSPNHIRTFSFDLHCLQVTHKEKVVLYFTSLRGIRKTYEDCCHVRTILKGVGVRVDERDVSMHSGFKEELKQLLGGQILLPRVFLGGNYIGGFDEIHKLHEDGQLLKLLHSCEKIDAHGVCEGCGDIRFVPCETCSGSSKIYHQHNKEQDDHHHAGEMGDSGFHRCPHCNENGLIRCPLCC